LDEVRNIIIIGAGPAGYTAALYAARANLAPLLFSGLQPGGQLTITTDVENYPGFPEGIMGPEMMDKFRDQAVRFGTEVIQREIEKVDFSKRPFTVWSDGKAYRAHAVIIASGASAKLLGIESESKLMGFGVSACATCDGFFFKGKKLAVVGGGDTAMEEATFLTRYATEVTVIHRRDALRASKIMQERALKNPKIKFLWDSEVVEVLGVPGQKVTGLKVKNVKSGEVSELQVEGLFIAIGHQPNTAFLADALPMDERGYLKVEPGSTRTAIPGVFASGDVIDPTYRQAVTAAGTGCMAAIDAERWLEAEGHGGSVGDDTGAKNENKEQAASSASTKSA